VGVGFDPSYRSNGRLPGITIHAAPFRAELAGEPNFICCRHVLEHLADPLSLLAQVRQAVHDHRETTLYFEVPNAMYTLRDMGIWDILYEHCAYYLPSSLARLFQRARFRPQTVQDSFGHQFLSIEAAADSPAGKTEPADRSAAAVAHLLPLVRSFAGAHQQKLRLWRQTLTQMAGRRVVIWGAGTKGVMFLNAVGDAADAIQWAVDANPLKHGRFVAGAGQEIVAPERLKEIRPETVLVMNPLYVKEIRRTLTQFGLRPTIATV
jgi:hypothetical protein